MGLCLAGLLLSGCVSGPQQGGARVPDWEADHPALAPAIYPPPAHPPAVSAPSACSPTNDFSETWVPLNRWCRSNCFDLPERMPGATPPIYTLRTTHGAFILRASSRVAHWNGVELRLGFAPQTIDGQPYIHRLDLKNTIQPLLAATPLSMSKSNSIIVIDPGHGGENAGARSVLGARYEKEFTLDWAMRLAGLLSSNGWQVFLTRTNDHDLALSNRVSFASRQRASLFVSLHFNSSAPDTTQSGMETYCLTPAGMPSTLTRGFDDDPSLVFPNNAFDLQNLSLAFRVHRALLQVHGLADRGVRRARFPGVLRSQQRPAVLIEGGYLSNPREARMIADPAYRQVLAEAVARGLEFEN